MSTSNRTAARIVEQIRELTRAHYIVQIEEGEVTVFARCGPQHSHHGGETLAEQVNRAHASYILAPEPGERVDLFAKRLFEGPLPRAGFFNDTLIEAHEGDTPDTSVQRWREARIEY